MPPILFSWEEPECKTNWLTIEGLNLFCKGISERSNIEVLPDDYYQKALLKVCNAHLPGEGLNSAVKDAMNYEASVLVASYKRQVRHNDINENKKVRNLLAWKYSESDMCDHSCELSHKPLVQSHNYQHFLQNQQKFRNKI